MRSVRALGVALALVTLLPAVGSAQEGRPFKDSWFWGAKAGAATYGQTAGGTSSAPLAGIDWLITRTAGGLYVSFSQGFLTQAATVDSVTSSDSTGPHQISLKNQLRVDLAGVAFPQVSTRVHPYVGLGVTVQRLGADYSIAGMSSSDQQALADSVTVSRTSVSPLILAGVQVRVPYVSVFAQGSFAPTQKSYYLSGGAGTFAIEAGVRYNIGSSIED